VTAAAAAPRGRRGGDRRPALRVVTSEPVRAMLDTGQLQPDHFLIELEFPSGQYYRRAER